MANEFIPNWTDLSLQSAKNKIKPRLKKLGLKDDWAADAPRMLMHLNKNWGGFKKQLSPGDREKIIGIAKKSPADLYVFLVTKHIFRKIGNAKLDGPSTRTIWHKMPSDAQFLYDGNFFIFEKVFSPEGLRDFIRGLFGSLD